MLDACAMIRTHTHTHTYTTYPSGFSLCARLSVDNRRSRFPPRCLLDDRIGSSTRLHADRTPQAVENSLKILDIYSYNLHVITLERRMYARCSLRPEAKSFKVQINSSEFL